jgi:hypothetical protein
MIRFDARGKSDGFLGQFPQNFFAKNVRVASFFPISHKTLILVRSQNRPFRSPEVTTERFFAMLWFDRMRKFGSIYAYQQYDRIYMMTS